MSVREINIPLVSQKLQSPLSSTPPSLLRSPLTLTNPKHKAPRPTTIFPSEDKVSLRNRHRHRRLRLTDDTVGLDDIRLRINPHAWHAIVESHVLFANLATILDGFDTVPEVVGCYCARSEGGGGDEGHGGGGDEGLCVYVEVSGGLVRRERWIWGDVLRTWDA